MIQLEVKQVMKKVKRKAEIIKDFKTFPKKAETVHGIKNCRKDQNNFKKVERQAEITEDIKTFSKKAEII